MAYNRLDEESMEIYFREIMNEERFPLLTKEQESDLVKKIHKGDKEAYDKLIGSYLKIVVPIAKKFKGRGLSLGELVAAGNGGLMEAAKKYEEGRGARFSTYSSIWIKQRIIREIHNHSRTVRVSVHGYGRLYKLKIARDEFIQKNKRSPTVSELSEYSHFPEEKIKFLLAIEHDGISLDSMENPEEVPYFLDDRENTERQAFREFAGEDIDKVLASLNEREKEIIKLRFGLDGKGRYSLSEVGNKYHLTRERIRQIEKRALNKIRANKSTGNLVDYLR